MKINGIINNWRYEDLRILTGMFKNHVNAVDAGTARRMTTTIVKCEIDELLLLLLSSFLNLFSASCMYLLNRARSATLFQIRRDMVVLDGYDFTFF